MSNLIVSRHEAFVAFVKEYEPELFGDAEVVAEATTEDVEGRIVAGILPPYLAVACGRYFTVQFHKKDNCNKPSPGPRGEEWSLEEMKANYARLQEYKVIPVHEILYPGVMGLIDHVLDVTRNIQYKTYDYAHRAGREG